MPNKHSAFIEQLIKRCPKSGRIVGLRRDTLTAQVLFPLMGVLALGWFLIRVIPKPSRANYPCQKVAVSLGAGFLGYLGALLLTVTGFRFLKQRLGQVVAVCFTAIVTVAIYCNVATSNPAAPAPLFSPSEGPNHPIGTAKGIFPGRVVWDQNFAVTSWDRKNGHWWDDKNIDQTGVDKMFSQSLCTLTGAGSDKQAWEKLFNAHNQTAGRGSQGYQKGEKLVVKINCNPEDGNPWGARGYPSPQVVNTLIRQLIENAGVPGNCILLTDPSRGIGDTIINKIRSNPGAEYQAVTYEGQRGGSEPYRLKPVPDTNSAICFDLPDGKKTLYFPKSFTEATYMINYATLRAHSMFGVTLGAKNHFGSVYDPEKTSFTPIALHAYATAKNKHGQSYCHPALLGHKVTGKKTLLYFMDGLYTARDQSSDIVRWSSLNNRWFSSLLMSQDPIALESVACDLIGTEPNFTRDNASFNENVDNFLHESALADAPPSKTKYTSEPNGPALQSLGVHEHWNNSTEKKYSRNLGKKEGIELIELH